MIFPTSRSKTCLLLSFLLVMTTCLVHAQRFPVYRDLHDFGGTVTNANGITGPDGTKPRAGIVFDKAGNAFGTSSEGGANGGSNGIIWEVTKSGTYIDLHDFGGTVKNASGNTGPDGSQPYCSVAFDSNGNMFGTTLTGGANGKGIVWEITKAGKYLDIHDFGGKITDAQGNSATDGVNPEANVTIDSAGNIFGTAPLGGGYGAGVVWEITTSGQYKDLHDFGQQYVDGSDVVGGVTLDNFGNIIGSTSYGGANGQGLLWKLSKTGVFQHLHDFGGTVKNADGKSGPDGTLPKTCVTIDANGNIFGTTPNGGPSDAGILWEITASGTYLDLHDFGGTITVADGQTGLDGTHPVAAVTIGPDGNLYGSASVGGPFDENNGNKGAGMLWEFTSSGAYLDIFDVGGNVTNPGFAIPSSIVFDANGNLYAVAFLGGANFSGTFWELGVLTVNSVSVSPTSVLGSQSSTGTVTLNGVAVPGGTSVALTSNSTSATVPATVTVAAGASTATFAIGTSAVGTSTTATISASVAGLSQTAPLTITPAVLSSFTVSPTSVVGGISSIGTVTLNGPAPTGGTAVTLSSGSSSALPPTTVTVPAGKTSVTFGIQTVQVDATTTATLSAGLAGTTLSASLTINPLALVSLSLSPTTVTGGNPSTGTVTLNGPAGSAGVTVTLASSSTNVATVPTTVKIATGQNSGTFSIPTTALTAQKTATISATFAGATQSATLTVVTPTLRSVSLNPGTLTGGSSATGTVTLTGPATVGGLVVKLTSSSAAATVPAKVTIAAGQTSATFAVKTKVVAVVTKPTITATLGNASQTTTLTINPPLLQSIAFSPSSVVGLTPGKGTVTLTGAAPTGGIKVALSSNNQAVTVPATVTVLAGQTTATFAAKTVSVVSQTVATITGTQGSVSQTATLTVNPPVLKSLTLSPTTVTGGKASTGTVTLGTAAPTGGITINLRSSSNSATVPQTVTVGEGSTSAKFKVTTSLVQASTKATITATLGSASQTANLTINK